MQVHVVPSRSVTSRGIRISSFVALRRLNWHTFTLGPPPLLRLMCIWTAGDGSRSADGTIRPDPTERKAWRPRLRGNGSFSSPLPPEPTSRLRPEPVIPERTYGRPP